MSLTGEMQTMVRSRRVPARAVPGLEAAEQYLRAHWRDRPTLEEVAAVAGLSACHFHSLFSRHFGFGPKWLLTELQMREARRLLLDGVPNRDVSAACGFANPSHFTARFKRWTGLTPGRWLRQERAGNADVSDDVTCVVEQMAPYQ